MKANLIPILAIFIFSLVLSLPLLTPGLYLIHDDQQVARLFLFDKAIKSGQFPVRWVDGLGFGFGYPLFVFYPPLAYIVGEVFHLAGFGFVDSTKLVFFFGIFASGLAMYILSKELWGKPEGTAAAIFYMYVPYRAIDVYIRGALAESFSFVWLPLILWSFWRLYKTSKRLYIYLSGIFLALLMITHNLIFLPFMLLLPIYLLFLIWRSTDKKISILPSRKRTILTPYSILLGFALSAFFWIPALAEKKFTIVDDLLLVSLANYSIHFVYPQQLWNWPWGFGGSAAGLADGLSFKIGKLHILVSIAALVLAIVYLFKNKKLSKVSIVNCQLSVVFFVLLLFAAFMTTFYSKFIWDLIPSLGYLQFPWRFLTFTALFSSIAAGALVYFLKLPVVKLFSLTVLFILLVITNQKLFKPQEFRTDFTDQIATSAEVINWDISHSSFEYVPKGVPLVKSNLGTNIVDIKKEDIPKTKIKVVSGEANLSISKNTPSEISFAVDAKENSSLLANIFNFPGWQVEVDGSKVTIDDSSRLKLISFEVEKGIHAVQIKFTNTPIRTLANSISLLTVLIILMTLFLKSGSSIRKNWGNNGNNTI